MGPGYYLSLSNYRSQLLVLQLLKKKMFQLFDLNDTEKNFFFTINIL